jgi:hypothetical protein
MRGIIGEAGEDGEDGEGGEDGEEGEDLKMMEKAGETGARTVVKQDGPSSVAFHN